MDTFFIFNAEYLYLLIVLIAVGFFMSLSRPLQKEGALLAIIYLPLTYLFAKVASSTYFNPRPFVSEQIVPLIQHSPDNGFPSDHTLLAAALATLIYSYHTKIGIIAWALAILVGLSRVYVGVHHLTDIIGSIVIAVITMWLVTRYILPYILNTKLYRRWNN